jgi:putative transposase
VVRPDTILKWHRDLIARRHAAVSRPRRPGRPRTLCSIRALVLRLARENSSRGYRRVHGELLVLGVQIAPSTVWEILREAGIDPAPDRAASTWAAFLRSQAEALLACDFFETVTLTGARMYVLAVIEHASRRIRQIAIIALVDLDPAFDQQLLHVAVRQAVTQVPADRHHDRLSREPEPGERRPWWQPEARTR